MYRFEYDNQEDDPGVEVMRTFPAEADLPVVLEQFQMFLKAAGFDYIRTIEVITDDGRHFRTQP